MKMYLFKLLFPSILIDYNHYKQLASRFDWLREENLKEVNELIEKNESLADYITKLSFQNKKLEDEIKHHDSIIAMYKKHAFPEEIKYYECNYCEFVTQVPSHFCPACDKDNTGKTKSDYNEL